VDPMFCAKPHGRPFFRMLSRPGASDPSSARRKPGHFSVPGPSPRTPSAPSSRCDARWRRGWSSHFQL